MAEGGPGGCIAIGGVGGVILLILTLLFGGDITDGGADGTGTQVNPGQDTQLNAGQVEAGGAQANDFSQCKTGADANRDVQCRVIGTVNSVQDF